MNKTLRKKVVLIIDDEKDLRRLARWVVELEGHIALEAGDSTEGINILKKERVDMAILDLKLPGHDGWLVLEEIKNNPDIKSIPVIIFTASIDALQLERAKEMGAFDYLIKPLHTEKLRDAIKRTLRAME